MKNSQRLKATLKQGLYLCLAMVFFVSASWSRPAYADQLSPYFLGFSFTVPILLAFLLWFGLGLRGLLGALTDGRRWWLLGLGLLTFWVLLSPSWARFQAQAGHAALQFAFVALFTLMITAVDFPPRYALYALVVGGTVQAIVVIGQMNAQGSIGVWALGEFNLYPTRPNLSVVVAGGIRLLRPYGLQAHPNIAAGYLMLGLLVAGSGLITSQRRWIRLSSAIYLAIGFWALLLTFSRSAWGGLVIGCMVVALLAWRSHLWRWSVVRQVLALCLLWSGIAALFLASYGTFVLARAGVNSTETEQISVEQRSIFIGFAVQLITRYPVAGTGIGTFPWESADLIRVLGDRRLRGENVHNVLLLITSELGTVGLFLWLMVYVVWGMYLWRNLHDPVAIGLVAVAVALLAIGLLDHYPFGMYHGLIWSFGCMGVACTPHKQS